MFEINATNVFFGVIYHNLQNQLLRVCHIYVEHSMLRLHGNCAKRAQTFKLRIQYKTIHWMLSAGHSTHSFDTEKDKTTI